MARYFHPRQFADLGMAPTYKRERGDPLAFDKRTRDPLWRDPEHWKEQTEMTKSASPYDAIEQITDELQRGVIGKNVAFSRAKSVYDASGYSLDRKDARGNVLSDHQQFVGFLDHHPVGKKFRAAHSRGLESTKEELEAEGKKVPKIRFDNSGSGAVDPNSGLPIKKTVSSICNAEIRRLAGELVKLAKRDGMKITIDKAVEVIITTPR